MSWHRPWDHHLSCRPRSMDAHTGKGLDLFPHHIDASIVASVQLQHHLSHILRPVDSTRQGEDGRRLAGSGGAVEQ